eukprot:8401160-Heterocapsa_arctica.AAC.1
MQGSRLCDGLLDLVGAVLEVLARVVEDLGVGHVEQGALDLLDGGLPDREVRDRNLISGSIMGGR